MDTKIKLYINYFLARFVTNVSKKLRNKKSQLREGRGETSDGSSNHHQRMEKREELSSILFAILLLLQVKSWVWSQVLS